jgi:hypothetical protein
VGCKLLDIQKRLKKCRSRFVLCLVPNLFDLNPYANIDLNARTFIFPNVYTWNLKKSSIIRSKVSVDARKSLLHFFLPEKSVLFLISGKRSDFVFLIN